MRFTMLLLVVGATAALALAGNARAQDPQIDGWGFSLPPDLPSVGEALELVVVVNASTTDLPIPLDFEADEYTLHVDDLVLEEIVPNPPLVEMHYAGGSLAVYQDPSFNAPFKATTAHDEIPDRDVAQVPAVFTDGEKILEFAFDDCITLWYDAPGIGAFAFGATELRLTGGTRADELLETHDDLASGWHLGGGFTNDPQAQIPSGYPMRYDIVLRRPDATAVEPATWGRIKASFTAR